MSSEGASPQPVTPHATARATTHPRRRKTTPSSYGSRPISIKQNLDPDPADVQSQVEGLRSQLEDLQSQLENLCSDLSLSDALSDDYLSC
jgi:hypothetical protein